MPSSSSRRLSATPYLPGAWPRFSRDQDDDDQDDDDQDADVSSVSSHGSFSVNLRARKDSSRKARRRWTYAGPPRSHLQTRSPSSDCPSSGPLGASPSQEVTMSPLTENTLSTAKSSPLNTPVLADWPTQLGGSHSLLLTNFVPSNDSPSSVARYHKSSPATSENPQTSFPVSRHRRFPSPHLDPPLLNFIPGLPSLNLSFPDLPTDFPFGPSSLSLRSAAYSAPSAPHSRSHLDLGDLDANALECSHPAVDVALSPQLSLFSVSSASHPCNKADSPILPAADVPPCGEHHPTLIPPAQEMDAFALATAVAASDSRTSFSLPPSVQSATVALPTLSATSACCDTVPCHPYRKHSGTTEASTGHHTGQWLYLQEGAHHQGLAAPDSEFGARTRRLSAPPPTARQIPPVMTTVSSRVDVGADAKNRQSKQPVLGKVRKFSERIRGFFKSKGESPFKGRGTGHAPEYGMMTTTTAVTNVEYESEHPIPLPSPRARLMRNHRRSLPLPLFLPPTADSMQSTLPVLGRRNPNRNSLLRQVPPSSPPAATIPKDNTKQTEHHQVSLPESADPCRDPRTPKAHRERTEASPQVNDNESNPVTERNKTRRFSLSSALTKSNLDTIRAAVVPRPPLPTVASRAKDEAVAVPPGMSIPLVATRSRRSVPRAAPAEEEQFWGGELEPVVRVTRSSLDEPPARSRTRTAPSQAATPSRLDTGNSPKDKRSRRFSLSSLIAKRSLRPLGTSAGPVADDPSGASPKKAKRFSRRRPRGDTVTTLTHDNAQFAIVSPPSDYEHYDVPALPPAMEVPPSHQNNLVPSVLSVGGESMYFDALDALEQASEEDDLLQRSYSPRPESDLDSMSFARTPDYSSGTFSFGSSTEREYYLEASEVSTSGYGFRPDRLVGTSAMGDIGESTSTPITKTLRFNPSLTFGLSTSDFGDDDEQGMLEREEELSFMRALGFEFDEIARRVREESM